MKSPFYIWAMAAILIIILFTPGVSATGMPGSSISSYKESIHPAGADEYTISGTVYYPGLKTGPVYIETLTPLVNGTFDSLGIIKIDTPGPYSITLPPGKYWMLAWMDVDGNPEGPARDDPSGSPVNRSVLYRPDTLDVTQNLDDIDITLYEIPLTFNAEFQIIDNRLARSWNDTLVHGTQSAPLETGKSLHVQNREAEGYLILDNMTVMAQGSHITEVYDKNYAVWDEHQIQWTYPDRYAIAPYNTMDFGWMTEVYIPGDIPFSLNRSVNTSVFSTPGYQLLTFNTTFENINCDWIYGSISAGGRGDAPVNVTLVKNTFRTDAPVESFHPDNDQAIGFNLNRGLMEAGRTYTFSVVLFVDPSRAHGLPMKYKPQVFMAQGFVTDHRSGTMSDTAIMPDDMLPMYVTHASVTSYSPNDWSFTSGSAYQMSLEQVIQAAEIPKASFTANRTSGYVPLAVVFNDTSTGFPTTWNWSFGDGTVSSVRHPVHTYTTSGDYTVSLIVTNADGCNQSVMVNYIKVNPPVKPLPGYTNPPTDPDNDGIYEDLNGNGRLDFADVVLYFNQMEWIALNEPVSAFDLNGNGRIDFADIVKLFGEI